MCHSPLLHHVLLSLPFQVVRLTVDHNPEDPREKERVKSAGGIITWTSMGRPRVNGRLNMTRSIGDVELKRFGVTAVPETRSLEVSSLFICLVKYECTSKL